ncbi:MAG TPA: carboxypeptidase-like regulatory domain-containing protein, partial [Candidatus Marinimicrobia bacterium]|nr:carboxypeptidase-like regulatory domain-containing protein [Candidatus Neomarinimicrobiota bacterium]
PLPGAQVYIPELEQGAIADFDGNYIILNVSVGSYDVSVNMMGYRKETRKDVKVMMDQTVWLNFTLPVAAVEGEEVEVIGERPLVEKGTTSKKITIDKEAVEALPIRDMTELYSLQSGVVQVVGQQEGAIKDHEERGLQEIHVRGGRSGEIAYMIDGMYIRNPIYGGIGTGTRLNLFAIKEFDWQPGGFNAEYGDAQSAVSNMHTNSGKKKFSYGFKYSTSLVGASLGNEYDEMRGYNDYNLGFGGQFPGFLNKFYYWLSSQYTTYENYRVYKFDDNVYVNDPEDPFNEENRERLVQPWDTDAGWRGFGNEKTWDVFGKLTYKFSNRLRFNASYWQVAAHRKGFNQRYLYWD